jgi:hypothetical protein
VKRREEGISNDGEYQVKSKGVKKHVIREKIFDMTIIHIVLNVPDSFVQDKIKKLLFVRNI